MSGSSKVGRFIEDLRDRILSEEFGPDGRLPSFRALATEYKTTQETMNKTMQALQAEGLLTSKGVKGVFVNSMRIRIPGLTKNFYDYLSELGLQASETNFGTPEFITPPNNIAKHMLLSKNDLALLRRRIQGIAKTPIRLVSAYYPKTLITDGMFEDICSDQHYDILENIKKKFKKNVKYIHEEVIIRLPTDSEQEQLKIVRTNPIVDDKLTCYSEDKKIVIMYLHMILNANHFLLSYDYSVDHWV